MKAITLVIAASLVMAKGFSTPSEKTIPSKITHVTVFLQGAQIIQEAQASLPAGKSVLTVTGISPFMDESSIQVGGQGAFTILSVNQRRDFIQTLEDSPEVKELKKKIEELERKNEDEKVALEILRERESFLVTNKNIGGKEEALNPESFRILFDLYGKNIDLVKSGILQKQRAIKENDIVLARLRLQLAEYQNRKETPKSEIQITVSAKSAVNAKFRISYLVNGAGWFPSYDIRVEKLGDPVTLVYKANVSQNTGVEWKNVLLTFSSATPNKSGNVPIPYPYFLDFVQIVNDRAYKSEAASSKKSMELEVESFDFSAMTSFAPEMTVGDKQTSVEFNMLVPYTISSESKSTSIDMQSFSLPSDFRYKAVPRLDPEAFLMARVYDWEQYDLLNGEANLYFENTFVGTSYIDTRSVADTLELSLGRDMGVVVKREKRKDFTSQRFIGNNKVETRSWEISVRNTKKEKIVIEIADQVPVSQQKEIVVDIQELSGGKLDKDKGFVTWRLELEAGQAVNLVLTYGVRYPRDRVVVVE